MTRNRYHQGPPGDHFDGERFFNPGQPSTDRSVWTLLRWQLSGEATAWPKRRPPPVFVRPATASARLRVTFVGHATLLVQTSGLNILVDPVWSTRVGPMALLGPARVNPPAVRFRDLPPIDAVLVSHNHYDHLDLGTLARLRRRDRPRVITPLGNATVMGRATRRVGVESGDWGDRFPLGRGVRVVLHPAYHWSARDTRDKRMALWCGFVIETPDGIVWISGDTGYGDGAPFRAVRERFGAPELAVVPIGAYAPRWFMQPQHVDPEEAVQMVLDCGARHAMGVHWGTFRLSDEGQAAPAEALEAACAAQGVAPGRVVAARPGDVWDVRR